jgi:hypothetical protein
LAIIDLDPTDEAVRGATLYWCERAGTWISERELEADESLRGWVIRYTWAGAEGEGTLSRLTYERASSWEEVRYCVSRGLQNPPAGAALNQVHVRRAYEDDWGDTFWTRGSR